MCEGEHRNQQRIRLRKSLGQNILLDPNINRKMVEAAGVTERDLVVEVGPGHGGLTKLLAQRAGAVFAVEIDHRFEPILHDKFGASSNVTIFIGDVLNHDLAELLASHLPHAGPLKMVSNLPYYITSPILEHFLESDLLFETIVVMVQNEVAERLTAPPGTREYGVLSLVTRFYAEVDKIRDVPRTCFRPVPEVDSAIVRFRCRRKTAVEGEDKKLLFHVIRAGFGERRKMLKNALARSEELGISREGIDEALRAADIRGDRRAETLDVDEFLRLSKALRDVRTS
jgi:16S rRNA (adenine1518-N6/adenine1519-N6)-dimethyltransferase